MFGPPGGLYVYFTYGMHWCANAVCGEVGEGLAVLLRALAPLDGLDAMRAARPRARRERDLCSGPAKLCQALGLDRAFDGADLVTGGEGVTIVDDGTAPPAAADVAVDRRIGLTRGAEHEWRWLVAGDPNVSVPAGASARPARPAGRGPPARRAADDRRRRPHDRRRPRPMTAADGRGPAMTGLTLRGAGDPLLAPSTDLAVAADHVRAIPPGDATREGFRARTLDLIATYPDALDRRRRDPGHLTGSGMVVDPASRRVLLLLHAKLRIWVQPGGHADGDASLPGVALKEATEETGIAGLRVATPALDVDIHLIPPPHGPTLHYDVRYLVVAPPGAVPVRNHESLDIAWLGLDELPGYGVDAGTLRLAQAGLAAFDALTAPGACAA